MPFIAIPGESEIKSFVFSNDTITAEAYDSQSLSDKDILDTVKDIKFKLREKYPKIGWDTLEFYANIGVAEVLQNIEKYDPRQSSLRYWTWYKGYFYAIEAMQKDKELHRKGSKRIYYRPINLFEDEAGNVLPDAEFVPDASDLEKEELLDILIKIDDIYQLVSPAAALLIKLYFFEKMTEKQISRYLDLHESRISQLLSAMIRNLKKREFAPTDFVVKESKLHPGWGQRIKNVRINLGLSYKQLERKVGIPQETIKLWEKEKKLPTYNQWKKLLDAFQIPAQYLLYGKSIKIWDLLKNKRNLVNKITSSEIMQWYETGYGLKPGDYYLTTINLGGEKSFFSKDGKRCRFLFYEPFKKGIKLDVIFLAEEDINHGLVFNCYSMEDIESEKEAFKPIRTFKCFPHRQFARILKLNVAGSDIVSVAHNLKKIHSSGRLYNVRTTSLGYFTVGGFSSIDGSYHMIFLKIPEDKVKKEDLIHEELVVAVEEDPNQGQVINAYRVKDYKYNEPNTPVASYQYFKEMPRKKVIYRKIMQIDPARLDILDAYEGKTLKHYGRSARCKIYGSSGNTNSFEIQFRIAAGMQRRMEITVPVKYHGINTLNKYAIVKVENDVNQGQVINVYLESEYENEKHPQPMLTYKYFKNKKAHYRIKNKVIKCRQVSLALLDMYDYYNGRKDLQYVERKPEELAVHYMKRTYKEKKIIDFYAHSKLMPGKQKIIVFALNNEAQKIYTPGEHGQKAVARLKEDPDYGLYIDISHDDTIVGTYYWFDDLKKCTNTDFDKMAFMDYLFDNKNVHGKIIQPRPHLHRIKVGRKRKKEGEARFINRGRTLYLAYLKEFIGHEVIFYFLKHDKYDHQLHMHVADEFDKNAERKPDKIFIKQFSSKRIVPIELASVKSKRKKKKQRKYTRVRKKVKPEKGALSLVDPLFVEQESVRLKEVRRVLSDQQLRSLDEVIIHINSEMEDIEDEIKTLSFSKEEMLDYMYARFARLRKLFKKLKEFDQKGEFGKSLKSQISLVISELNIELSVLLSAQKPASAIQLNGKAHHINSSP